MIEFIVADAQGKPNNSAYLESCSTASASWKLRCCGKSVLWYFRTRPARAKDGDLAGQIILQPKLDADKPNQQEVSLLLSTQQNITFNRINTQH